MKNILFIFLGLSLVLSCNSTDSTSSSTDNGNSTFKVYDISNNGQEVSSSRVNSSVSGNLLSITAIGSSTLLATLNKATGEYKVYTGSSSISTYGTITESNNTWTMTASGIKTIDVILD